MAEPDPRIEALRQRLARRPPRRYPREDATLEAAVTVVLRDAGRLELLLIERVERAEDPWSGHIALPGGRREAADPDLLTTALRETEEEVGIALDPAVHLLGPLDEVRPSSRRLPPLIISPFVAEVEAEVRVDPDPREVAQALWVPVEVLRDERSTSEVLVERGDFRASFPAIHYRGYDIWGLTRGILLQLLELLPG